MGLVNQPHPIDAHYRVGSKAASTDPSEPAMVNGLGSTTISAGDYVFKPDWSKRDWRAMIRARQNATTVMYGRRFEVTSMGLLAFYERVAYKTGVPATPDGYDVSRVEGVYHAEAPYQWFWDPSIQNYARGQFLAKCRQQQRPFMAGVALGELRETVEMIRRPAKALFQGYWNLADKIKHLSQTRHIYRTVAEATAGRGTRAHRRKVKTLSGLWLEAQYGWKPLYNDIHSAAEALARKYAEQPTIRVVSKQHADGKQSTKSRGFGSQEQRWSTLTTSRYGSLTFLHSGAVRIQSNGIVSSSLGLSTRDLLQDLVPTAWELIPWSFVVDYFFNIGNVIEASQFVSSDLAWAFELWSQSCTSQLATDIEYKYASPPPKCFEYIQSNRSGIYIANVVDFYREPYSGAFVPTLSFRVPTGAMKWLNLTALASQFVASGRVTVPHR